MKAAKQSGLNKATREELYELAKERGVDGRSSMINRNSLKHKRQRAGQSALRRGLSNFVNWLKRRRAVSS